MGCQSEVSTYFCPEGALRKCFCQFCSTAMKCRFELWFHGISRPEAPALGGKRDRLWKQFWRIFPWCERFAHSVACRCFWLQIVNHELHIDLSPSPSYLLIFHCCALLSLSLREVSMEEESAWLNWKSTGLMLDRPAWLHHLPGAWPQGRLLSEPQSWKMEPIISILQGCFCWENKWKLRVRWALCRAHSKSNAW